MIFDNICQAISKPGGAGHGAQVAIISVTQLKLLAFYVQLNQRISCLHAGFDQIMRNYLDLAKDQRKVNLENAKTKVSPDLKPLTLDLANAPTCFEKVKTPQLSTRLLWNFVAVCDPRGH